MNRIFLIIVLFNLCFSSCIKEAGQKDVINGDSISRETNFIKNGKGNDNLSYVNSFIGSTGPTDSDYGGTIPSVAPPFAMTQWCAMTRENYISQNPYNYRDSVILGFIGTHQPAIWMGDYGFVSFLPSSGKVKITPKERALKFSHDEEIASPYFYAVNTKNENGETVSTEMASTSRCAIF